MNMKRVYLLLAISLIPLVSFCQNSGSVNQGNDNAVVREKTANHEENVGRYVNGKKDGIWTNYNDKGMLRAITEYKNGEKNGLYVTFDHQGTLEKEEYYVNGKLDGESKKYLHGNYVNVLAHYKNGELDGEYKQYYTDKPTQLMEESFYVDGVKDGKSTYFGSNGNAVAEYTYTKGLFNGVKRW